MTNPRRANGIGRPCSLTAMADNYYSFSIKIILKRQSQCRIGRRYRFFQIQPIRPRPSYKIIM